MTILTVVQTKAQQFHAISKTSLSDPSWRPIVCLRLAMSSDFSSACRPDWCSEISVLNSSVPCWWRPQELQCIPLVVAEALRGAPSVGEWLESLQLLQLENILLVNGFDDMRFMVRATRR